MNPIAGPILLVFLSRPCLIGKRVTEKGKQGISPTLTQLEKAVTHVHATRRPGAPPEATQMPGKPNI